MSKEYINIYNNSLGSFLDVFSQSYNLDNEELKERYTYVYSKKLTGYMLFVQDMYENNKIDTNQKFTVNSKIISGMWKTIDKNVKKGYNDTALMQNSKGKVKKVVKKVEEEVKIPEIIYNDDLDDISLQEIEIDGIKYIKDVFNNIISINENNEGNYIGLIKDGEVIIF